ncbi:serpin family protein [Thermoflexus sp.]|uniref:serpin family protein n=1 Tax=Thermoflexus sp. TaxID=1969742 RepID=UPI002ADD708A|nr:serpin family protein [Thermoflexus sp.]
MKTVLAYLLSGLLLLSAMAACVRPAGPLAGAQAPSTVVQPLPVHILQSSKPRSAAPEASLQDLEQLVQGNTAFALDLYHYLRKSQGGNLFYSPYSISLALAMTYAGARGETEQAMARTLRFSLPSDRLHPTFNALDQALIRRGQGAKGKDEKGFRLRIVNALWGQVGHPFRSEFLDLLAEHYGAGLRGVDFARDPEAARALINDWVRQQTEGRIQDLIPPNAIDPLTRLVLTNALYFNAAWAEPFDPDLTREDAFYLLDGTEIRVPMMQQTTRMGYAEGEDYQAVEIPYDGWELAMVVIAPKRGQFETFEASLDTARLQEILQGLTPREVALTFPRFRVESFFRLAEALGAMGMRVAFTPGEADFSGMDGTRNLFIGDVLHKAFVAVDEAGTEAAAATAVVMKATAIGLAPVEVKVDRPFIFLIRDLPTGAVLFVGRVVHP